MMCDHLLHQKRDLTLPSVFVDVEVIIIVVDTLSPRKRKVKSKPNQTKFDQRLTTLAPYSLASLLHIVNVCVFNFNN